METIQARQLGKRFRGVAAVDRMDLSVGPRGVVGLLGLNGAGKTTTLRLLAGALAPTEGTAQIAGFDLVSQTNEVRARVGFLPETPPLYTELTVGEHLRTVGELRGIAARPLRSRVGSLLEQFELSAIEDRRIDRLSRGLRQRVGLAAATLHDPPLLLLDEPTAGLDPRQQAEFRRRVRAIGEERAVLVSTHHLAEAEALCDRLVVLHRGRVVADGSPAALAGRRGRTSPIRPRFELALLHDSAVEAEIAQWAGVVAVERGEAGRYRIDLDDLAFAPSIVAAAVSRGWSVAEWVHRPPSLEQAVVELLSGLGFEE
jgi:ABC-2 type transport system ATP-binding protein